MLLAPEQMVRRNIYPFLSPRYSTTVVRNSPLFRPTMKWCPLTYISISLCLPRGFLRTLFGAFQVGDDDSDAFMSVRNSKKIEVVDLPDNIVDQKVRLMLRSSPSAGEHLGST